MSHQLPDRHSQFPLLAAQLALLAVLTVWLAWSGKQVLALGAPFPFCSDAAGDQMPTTGLRAAVISSSATNSCSAS